MGVTVTGRLRVFFALQAVVWRLLLGRRNTFFRATIEYADEPFDVLHSRAERAADGL